MSYILIPQYVADWFIKNNERIPDYYIVVADAEFSRSITGFKMLDHLLNGSKGSGDSISIRKVSNYET